MEEISRPATDAQPGTPVEAVQTSSNDEKTIDEENDAGGAGAPEAQNSENNESNTE
jgi:hypothetical protein